MRRKASTECGKFVIFQGVGGIPRYNSFGNVGYSAFAKQILTFAEKHLPEGKDVFYIYTHGAPGGNFLKGMREIAEKKHCKELGEYRCQGFDTFGPFKLVGGIAKGHPTDEEIQKAVDFYERMAHLQPGWVTGSAK